MQLPDLYQKASRFEFLSKEEGVFLFEKAPLTELMFLADELRKKQVPHGKVTWQIDRNVTAKLVVEVLLLDLPTIVGVETQSRRDAW